MKVLVVYYSRTGHAKELAGVLASAMNADCEEIVDVRAYKGALGFVRGCITAIRKTLPHICPPRYQPRDYDRVVLVAPIWADLVAPAMRSYIDQYGDMCKKVLLFCVSRSSHADKAKEELEKTFQINIETAVGFTEEQLKKGDVLHQITEMSGRA